jgi:hypothetical protein
MSPKGIEEVGSIPTAEVEIDNPVFFPPCYAIHIPEKR